ncbi:MAG: hypothetical protein ACYTEZ_15715 [Planctomycetota bacterium]|jgi:hypothetical protein
MGRLFAGLLCCGLAAADAVIVTKAMTASTIAEVFVTEHAVRVELEIGVADFRGFCSLLPDELHERLGYPREPWAGRLQRFLDQDWVVRADGKPLAGRLKRLRGQARVQRDEITGEPLGEDGEGVLFAEIEYPLEVRPTSLTLRPPMTDAGVTANIGFVVYHQGLPVNDFRYLAGAETLDLDWSDPWYSQFRNRNLRRRYYAPVQAFLYVEPFEVRQEVIARPRDLQQWIDLGLAGKKVLRAEEQAGLKQKVAAFLARKNPVHVDGRPVEMRLDRIHFVRRSLRRTGVIDPPEDLDVAAATLGVIFFAPTPGLPQQVTMRWELWAPRIRSLPTVATDEAGGMPSTLTPDDPVLTWRNFLRNPSTRALVALDPPRAPTRVPYPSLAAVAAAGFLFWRRRRRAAAVALVLAVVLVFVPVAPASTLTKADAGGVLSGLLKNVYRAFDRREESLVYDRLARSMAGDLLPTVYLQTRQSMELENQGGARVTVQQVELVGFTHEAAAKGFVTDCTWNVAGSVGHWGHLHRRTNQYRATVRVQPVDGVWKITELELLDEVRLP